MKAVLSAVSGIALLALLAGGAASAAGTGVGQKYQARDPRTCASTKAPAKGAPSAAQATQYVVCSEEKVLGDYLYLATDMHVEVGAGTPYSKLGLGARPSEADPKGTVYAIRGSYKLYQCEMPSGFTPAGKQCRRWDKTNATGICYKTQFADWSCDMDDLAATRNGVSDLPPPPGF